MKLNYRRHLPHIQPPGCVLFITFRVAGSLPTYIEKELVNRAQAIQQGYKSAPPSCPEMVVAWKKLFKYADDQLDRSKLAAYLTEEAIAHIVVQSIYEGQLQGHYRLHRYCIMSNHVHLLIEPMPVGYVFAETMTEAQWPPVFYTQSGRLDLCGSQTPDNVKWRPAAAIMKSLKGTTARHINKILQTSGAFWSQESYDHWIRNADEYGRVVQYIDNNPVKANLCAAADRWRWGSAGEEAGVSR